MGCAHTVKVIIQNLPGQTAESDTQVTLSNIGPSDDRGYGNISIPGIGSGHILVNFHIGSIGEYTAEVSDIPGQTGEDGNFIPSTGHCPSISSALITIPRIGSGRIARGWLR